MPTIGDRSRGSARRRLLQAAAESFYARGIQATGIDTITAAAGVAKMTLYNNFRSKDDLVEAYLHARHVEWLDFYHQRLQQATSPIERVLAVFDAYRDHASQSFDSGFRGCGLLNAAAELPTGSPGRAAVRQHKEEVEGIILAHLTEAGVQPGEATTLARHLSFVLEGATVRAGLDGDDSLLIMGRACAQQVLERACTELDR